MSILQEAPIEDVEITKINPAKYNPRRQLRPGDKEYEDIRHSLKSWGLVQPLVWNKQTGTLVGGHQRLNVIKNEMPDQKTVRCSVIDVDEKTEKALNIVLNRVGEGLWSENKLKTVLNDLNDKKVDLNSLGFTEEEIEKMLKRKTGRGASRNPDDAPAPASKPKTKLGDVYRLLGPDANPQHTIICGDSSNPETIVQLFGDQRANAIITDPPYGVAYVSQSKSGKMSRQDIANDELRGAALRNLLTDTFRACAEHTAKNSPMYSFYASRCHIEFEEAMQAAGWEVRQQLIWAKRMALGRSNYHWAHEPILYAAKEGEGAKYHGDRAQTTILQDDAPSAEELKGWKKDQLLELAQEMVEASTVIHCKQDPPSSYIHPTQKPVALIGKLIKHATLPGQSIFDPFLGSGSAVIAAEIEGRNCFGCELEPGHVDAIVKRYAQTFEEVLIYRNGKEVNPETLNQV